MNDDSNAKEWVAILLAIGIATAVNLITVAVLYDAIFSKGPGLSDNATQILTTAFGGIIGVLGGYIGYKAGLGTQQALAHTPTTTQPTTPTDTTGGEAPMPDEDFPHDSSAADADTDAANDQRL